MNCSDSRPESVGKQNNTLSCPALNVAFTGHRADSLPWGFNESSDECIKLKAGLLRAIRCAYTDGKRCFLSGMASGVDIYAAEAVLQLRETLPGIALACVFPCPSRDSRSGRNCRRCRFGYRSQFRILRRLHEAAQPLSC